MTLANMFKAAMVIAMLVAVGGFIHAVWSDSDVGLKVSVTVGILMMATDLIRIFIRD